MMEKMTFEEAVAYFQKFQPQWGVICDELRKRRDEFWGNQRRNMETPSVQDRQTLDYQLMLKSAAYDDILYDFEGEYEEPEE